MIKRIGLGVMLLLAGSPGEAGARGVTPYLPLNLDPQIERQVERVLILADKPVMRRPIPAAVVLDALPKACEVDAALCERPIAACRYVSWLTIQSRAWRAFLLLNGGCRWFGRTQPTSPGTRP